MSKDFFHSIVEHLPDGIWVADAGHRIVYANAAMARIAEVPVDALLGMSVLADFPEETLEFFRPHYLAAVADLQLKPYDCPVVTPAGRYTWQGGWLTPMLQEGRLVAMMCSVQDLTERKGAEDALLDDGQLLRAVINEIPDPIILKDHKGDFLLCNRSVANLYNTTPEAMVGKHDDDFGVPKELADSFRQNVLAIMEKGETTVVLEDSRDAETGEIRHYRSIKKPLKDPRGNNQILVIAQDLTDVIRSQAKVAESERRLQEVLTVTSEGVWDWHLPSGRVMHNSQWYEILGAKEGEIPGTVEAFANIIHADDKPAVWARLDAALKGETAAYHSEHRLYGKNGIIWVQDRGGIVERDADGKPLRFVGSYADITSRRHAEEKLARLLEEQQTILQSEVVGIVMVRDNIMSWMNSAYARMLGYDASELTNQPTRLFYPNDEAWLAFQDSARPTIAAGKVYRTQIQCIRKDGSSGWFDISCAELHEVSSASIWAIVDISSQKRTETELIEARQTAERANLAKSQFLATMSHEIRTPMNGILGMAQLLLMPNPSEQEQREYARTILNSGQTLLTLLNDILDFSKVEAGKLELIHAAVDPRSLLEEATQLFSGQMVAKGLMVELDWRGPAAQRYWSDPIRLRQMLSNLISNAIKFTERGFVRVEAHEVRCDGTMALLEFSVADSGIGIPVGQQNLLFQPFSQTDSSSTRLYGGTGLGLSIVSSLAKLMGGETGVDSEAGKGSRFWFRIEAARLTKGQESRHVPRSGDGAPAPGEQTEQLPPSTGYVLVVEDNPINRKVIGGLLRKLGIRNEIVDDGQKAVDAIVRGMKPDLVLMDIQMPVMDGLSATRHIRHWEKENRQPARTIVALTAGAFEEDRANCDAAGMDDFLAKPINLDDLRAMLAKWRVKEN